MTASREPSPWLVSKYVAYRLLAAMYAQVPKEQLQVREGEGVATRNSTLTVALHHCSIDVAKSLVSLLGVDRLATFNSCRYGSCKDFCVFGIGVGSVCFVSVQVI